MLMIFLREKAVFCRLLSQYTIAMKYRRLTHEELLALEADFVRFLALNGIPAEEWIKLKSTDAKQVNAWIEQFSDAIFERSLREVEFLEFYTPKDIKTFHCQKEKIVLVGLVLDEVDENASFMVDDLTPVLQLIESGTLRAKRYRKEKQYHNNDREMELFNMIENGARISKDGRLFKILTSGLAHE